MKAVRILRQKQILADGGILQMTIWQIPEQVPSSLHRWKYSLFYGYPGRRIVGFDNERGKGDHWHLDDDERPYAFESVERLLAEFIVEVRRAGGRI